MSDNTSASCTDEEYLSEPSDWEALASDGENQARKELGNPKLTQAAKDIARHLEIYRPINWSRGIKQATSGRHRVALVLQRRGDVIQPKCMRCQNTGLFTECVAAPVIAGAAFQQGSCASCVWGNHVCSLRGNKMALDNSSITRFLAVADGEYSLRDAIKAQDEALTASKKAKPSQEKENESLPEEMEKRNVQKVPSSTFFGAFLPDRKLNRVGVSQRGPHCAFDGDELKFPISRSMWASPRRLLTVRSDLAHFLSIVDARLYELGEGGDDDSFFWRKEAQRIPALYDAPQPLSRDDPIQVARTQEQQDESFEVPETQLPREETAIEEPPDLKPAKSRKKIPKLASSRDTPSEIPDSQDTNNEPPASSDNDADIDDTPTRPGGINFYRKGSPYDDSDMETAGGATSTYQLAKKTATQPTNGTSALPKNMASQRGHTTGRKQSSLGAAIDILDSNAGYSSGLKRWSSEPGGEEPLEKRSKGGEDFDATVIGGSAPWFL